jgi:hypothetical protein
MRTLIALGLLLISSGGCDDLHAKKPFWKQQRATKELYEPYASTCPKQARQLCPLDHPDRFACAFYFVKDCYELEMREMYVVKFNE